MRSWRWRELQKKKGRWIEAVVCSVAVHSVASKRTFPGSVKSTEMSLAGKRYKAGNDIRISNKLEKSVLFDTFEGDHCHLKIQVAEVEGQLMSV